MSKPVELLKQKIESIETSGDIGKTVRLDGISSDVAELYFTKIAEHLYNLNGTVMINSDPEAEGWDVITYPSNLVSDIEIYNNGTGEDRVEVFGWGTIQGNHQPLTITISHIDRPTITHVIAVSIERVPELNTGNFHFDSTFYSSHNITATEASSA